MAQHAAQGVLEQRARRHRDRELGQVGVQARRDGRPAAAVRGIDVGRDHGSPGRSRTCRSTTEAKGASAGEPTVTISVRGAAKLVANAVKRSG